MKKLFFILALSSIILMLKAQTVKFHVDNFDAYPYTGPFMFQFDDPLFPVHDQNAYTGSYNNEHFMGVSINNFAYTYFKWNTTPGRPLSASNCQENNTNLNNGQTGNIKLKIDDFELAGFRHLNTEDNNTAWNARQGEHAFCAGDYRHYVNGTGIIYNDADSDDEIDAGEVLLTVNNCLLEVEIPYPSAQQAINNYGFPDWQNNIGTGKPYTASGWGTMVQNQSNQDWYNAFNEDGEHNGQLEFTFSGISNVSQGVHGYFDLDITLEKADHVRIVRGLSLAGSGFENEELLFNSPVEAEDCDVDFEFDSFTAENPPGAQEPNQKVSVIEYYRNPGGDLPKGIQRISDLYWNISTSLSSFNTSITFDLEDINLRDDTNLRIIYRKDKNTSWNVVDVYNYQAGNNSITVNNVTEFGEWAIGSKGNTLPVEFSTFSLTQSGDDVNVKWVTQTESDLRGFYVLRSETEDLASANKISDLISASNTVSAQEYVYEDKNTEVNKRYWYWIEANGFNEVSSFTTSQSILLAEENQPEEEVPEAELFTGIKDVYPNPFNPPVNISFYIDKKTAEENADAEIEIYNARGQKVHARNLGIQTEGMHTISWNGNDEEGKECGSGIYFVKFTAGSHRSFEKSIKLK